MTGRIATRARLPHPVAAVAAAVALPAVAALLGACGGNDPTPASSGGAQFGAAEFGLDEADLNQRIDQVEAAISACMADAGFDYVAVDASTVRAAMSADGTLPGVSDADFVAQYGFGVTTIAADPVADLGRGEQNAATYAALSTTEQASYDRTLIGEGGVPLARALEDEDLSGTGGCTRAAVEPVFTAEELTGSYVNPADAAMEQDPRMIGAIEAWSACLTATGYSYAHPDDVTAELADRYAAIVGTSDPASLTGGEADALVALQGEERAVAVAATTCEETHIVPVQETIEAEIYGGPQP